MPNYNTTLQSNNTDLQAILNSINELPEAGGVELPALTNEGVASDLLSGKELIDGDGNKVTGTFSIDSELTTQDSLIAQIQAAVDSLPEAGSGNGERVISITNDSTSRYGIYYLDKYGTIQEASPGSTFNALCGIAFRVGVYNIIWTGDYITLPFATYNAALFKTDGGIIRINESSGGGSD